MHSKESVRRKFIKGFSTYESNAKVQQRCADELVRRISLHKNAFSKVLELGTGTGVLTRKMLEQLSISDLFLNDISNIHPNISYDYNFIEGDAEFIDFPKKLDLIASNAVIQWFHDLREHLHKSYNALNNDGLLAFTTFGPDNLIEIRRTTGAGLTYVNLSQLRHLLNICGFQIIDLLEQKEYLFFNNASDVLKHLKATGVNSLYQRPWTKGSLRNFIIAYSKFREGNKYQLTYHPITIIAKKL